MLTKLRSGVTCLKPEYILLNISCTKTHPHSLINSLYKIRSKLLIKYNYNTEIFISTLSRDQSFRHVIYLWKGWQRDDVKLAGFLDLFRSKCK